MNIEHVGALAAQLRSLGFDDPGLSLLRRVCLRPESFVITQHAYKNAEAYIFHLQFEKDGLQDKYQLKYYDAILQKENTWEHTEINGVNLKETTSMMSGLDWKTAFDFDETKQWTPENKGSWEKESKVDAVIGALKLLEETEEGKAFSMNLKVKYWTGLPYHDFFGNIGTNKNKADVSQRFYVADDQSCISINEAIRFLQNRWVEKQMQTKKKSVEADGTEYETAASRPIIGRRLLNKKALHGSKRGQKDNQTGN